VESAGLGLILDSSVVIAGERRGHTVRQILEQFKTDYGEIEIGPVTTPSCRAAAAISRSSKAIVTPWAA
jgi:hypothetical protein